LDRRRQITVTRSCLYKCSFCNIPQGRGAFESVPLADVLAKAKAALEQGKKHFVLIGDEVGNYGVDGGSSARLPELLEAILAIDPAIFLSIRYIEPKPFLRYERELLAWSKAGRIRLLYLSLQSGSQRILRAMNRGYDVTRITQSLTSFRNSTETVLYGNWLVGFPGEEEGDFLETKALVETLDFHINVAIPFSARPGTPAMSMADQLDDTIKTDRVLRLTATIAQLKVKAMERTLVSLNVPERETLLARIQQAEAEQYAPAQQQVVA
jgi:tRNA A37 methylthiotransferase MiaB